MIITIGRECGCKGDTVGRALAKKFNIPIVQVLEEVTGRSWQ